MNQAYVKCKATPFIPSWDDPDDIYGIYPHGGYPTGSNPLCDPDSVLNNDNIEDNIEDYINNIMNPEIEAALISGGCPYPTTTATPPQPKREKNKLAKAFNVEKEEEAIGIIVGIVIGSILSIYGLYVLMRPTRRSPMKPSKGLVKKATSRR